VSHDRPGASVRFGEVRLSLAGAAGHEHRAERISRLTFDHVHRLLDASRPRLRSGAVSALRAGPLPVSLDLMDDDAVARASAAEIYRALLARAASQEGED
jgi:hypothetical protein